MWSSTVLSFCIAAGVLAFASVVNSEAIQGIPGVDYPSYHSIPKTSFSCAAQKYIPGFFADLETDCQAFHFCFKDGHESFLCPTGSTFNQAKLACDVWHASNCSLTPLFYSVNSGPALKTAGRNLPALMKMRSRTQGKSMPSSAPNIFQTLSSLHTSDFTTTSEGVESSNLAGDSKVVSDSSESRNTSSEKSATDQITEKDNPLEDYIPGVGDGMQGDASSVEETDTADEPEDFEEIEEDDIVYDPNYARDGYYMDYDPYDADWQQGSEQEREFNNFYQEGDYEAAEDERLSEEDSDMYTNTIPEGLGYVGEGMADETEFSRRRWQQNYRRRPAYVVLEDTDEEKEFPGESDYLQDEPGQSSTEHVSEASSEAPSESVSEGTIEANRTSESSTHDRTNPPGSEEVSEDVLRRLQFSDLMIPSYDDRTERPLTTGEFEERIISELVEPHIDDSQLEVLYPLPDQAQQDEAVTTLPSEHQQFYLQDLMHEPDAESSISDSAYPVDASEGEDTFLILPEETDEVPDSNAADTDETTDASNVNEYSYEVDPALQADAEVPSDEGYSSYEDAYEYYKSHRQVPEGYETVESTSYQRPGYDYSQHYESQYRPGQDYGGYGQYPPEYEGEGYTPDEARQAYMSGLISADDYNRILYRYQSQAYGDPSYDAEAGYYGDEAYNNAYDESEAEASNYYESDEENQAYSRPDAFWVEQDSEAMVDELGVTDTPLPIDITEAANLDLDETATELEDEEMTTVLPLENESEPKEEETFYVLDDEESEGNADSSDDFNLNADENMSDTDAYSEINLETDNLQSLDESTSNDTSFYDDGTIMSLLSSKTKSEPVKLDDPFLNYNIENVQSSDSLEKDATKFTMKPQTNAWSNSATESSVQDKPVTLSSTLERLAVLNSANPSSQFSDIGNMDFSNDAQFLNSMAFPGSMDFGPYGYGASFGQQYGMLDSMNSGANQFSHRDGDSDKSKVPRLSSLQQKLRSMKQGKFGAFKKYMNNMKIRKR